MLIRSVVVCGVLVVGAGCARSADRVGSYAVSTSKVSVSREEASNLAESVSTTEGGGSMPDAAAGSYDALEGRLVSDPLFDRRPDPRVVVLRVQRGFLTSSVEAEFRSAFPDVPAGAQVFVFECSFTSAELEEFIAFLLGGKWRDGGSKAARVQWPRLRAEIGWTGVADCAVFDPIECLSATEIEAISAAAGRLNVSHVDLSSGERADILYEADSRFPPGVWAYADPECTYRSTE